MTTIVTRTSKGSLLSWVEADANFTNLNTDKLETTNNLSDLDSALLSRANLGIGNVDNTSDVNKPISTLQAAALALKQDAIYMISSNATLSIPAGYATINDAFAYLASKTISAGVTITIQVADGTYNLTSGISANHPQGAQIRLVGNETTPANCVLQVTGMSTFDAISASAGNTLGWLNGFRINATTKADLAHNTTGVLAVQNATIICGPKMEVNNFYYGIASRDGSYIYCPNAAVTNAGDVGIWSFCGSTIVCNGASSSDASDVTNGYGFGFQAEFGSTLVNVGGYSTGCYKAGFAALSNSTLRLSGCTSTANTGSGYLSWAGGQVEAFSCIATNNTRYGIEITENGKVIGVGTNTGNTLGAVNGFAYSGELSGQARLAASTGPLHLDAGESNSTYFNNANGINAEIQSVAGAVNHPVLRSGGPSTGNQPAFAVEGSDANITVQHWSKGTGGHFFNTGGGIQAEIFDTPTSVNWTYQTGGASGVAPRIGVSGSDTDIDLRLNTKGAGVLRFGSYSPTGDVACNGFITIKDNAGTVRKLMTTA